VVSDDAEETCRIFQADTADICDNISKYQSLFAPCILQAFAYEKSQRKTPYCNPQYYEQSIVFENVTIHCNVNGFCQSCLEWTLIF
jgi:hypothetical protein